MPRFRYTVELTDGTIAKKTTERIYTHLIEISPRTLESHIKEMNENIEYWTAERDRYEAIDIEQSKRDSVRSFIAQMRDRNIPSSEMASMVSRHEAFQDERYGEDWKRERISYCQDKIDGYALMRDVAIADGHPTVGKYFASNWCGSYDLAVKKLNSADVRFWTERGRTARIVHNPQGENNAQLG